MPEENKSAQEQTNYFDDATENAGEMSRLIKQGYILTREMGGVFPAQFAPASLHDVLDIACGPGEWVLEVAQATRISMSWAST